MKKLLIILSFIILLLGCEDKGITSISLNGTEENLPKELKGLKIYNVSQGGGVWVKVAIFDNEVNSLSYKTGKTSNNVILVNKTDETLIEISKVMFENDSMIICKK